MYMRDMTLPAQAAEWWEKLNKQDNDEPSWARITDELVGGWQGIDVYWDNFEAMFCNLHKASPYDRERLDSKDLCWVHYQGGK
jgi:hypothetical protein